jgi:hypothetical protein
LLTLRSPSGREVASLPEPQAHLQHVLPVGPCQTWGLLVYVCCIVSVIVVLVIELLVIALLVTWCFALFVIALLVIALLLVDLLVIALLVTRFSFA